MRKNRIIKQDYVDEKICRDDIKIRVLSHIADFMSLTCYTDFKVSTRFECINKFKDAVTGEVKLFTTIEVDLDDYLDED